MSTEFLFNRKGRPQLEADIQKEGWERRVLSFYRYQRIEDPQGFRDDLYRTWSKIRVLGRIYVAEEGINAQLSVPVPHWETFVASLNRWPVTAGVFLNLSEHNDRYAFLKLKIKIRKFIVADNLEYDVFKAGKGEYLEPIEFNRLLSKPEAVVVDTRNDYECETGYFEGAYLPKSQRFSEVLPEIAEKLAAHKQQPVLLYCTGGIRCEKAGAYLKGVGFERVYQLRGGIINYLKTVQQAGEPSRYQGSLFVFDGRMAEPALGKKVAHCYTCDQAYDIHRDCAHEPCHRLIIQCPGCFDRLQGCCSPECLESKNATRLLAGAQ